MAAIIHGVFRGFVLAGLLLGLVDRARADAALPEPPRVLLDTKPTSCVVTGMTRTLAPGDNLQAALNAAAPGDEIVLPAGATFQGNFVLPAKTGTEWITLRTSSTPPALPAEGERVTPAHAPALAKLIAPNDQPVLRTASAAARYRLLGLELTVDPAVSYSYGLVGLGSTETSLDQVPRDIILDRCYIHGDPQKALKRGVTLNSAFTVIANCWISECHVIGQDAQAIGCFNSPGPFKIVNNRLEAACENVMFGGADPSISNLVPADIEVRRNYFFKPLSWRVGEPDYGGLHWSVKNLLELKNARRVWVEGNVLEHSWSDAQVGFAILLTVRNQGGAAPWCAVEDVTLINNLVRHGSSGFTLIGEDDAHSSQPARRVLIRNNLLIDINRTRWGGDGRMFQVTSPNRPVQDLTIDHNTILDGGSSNGFLVMGGAGKAANPLAFRDNIIVRGQYGIHGDGTAEGMASLNAYCPSWDVSGNVLIGPSAPAIYPPLTRFVASIAAAKFVDIGNEDYGLAPDSPCRGAATDGGDPGIDMDALAAAIRGAEDGSDAQASARLSMDRWK